MSGLPLDLLQAEQRIICGRRRFIPDYCGLSGAGATASPPEDAPQTTDDGHVAKQAPAASGVPLVDGQPVNVGLAMSGGGARSAPFNLGVLQALAEHHVLRAVDYLSTVSGGGHIGAFLGRFFTRFANRPTGAIDIVEARLADANSPEITWLRRSSDYVAAAAVGESPVTSAHMLRAFFTVHFMVGMVLVTTFNIANLIRYVVFPWLLDPRSPWPVSITLAFPAAPYLSNPWLVLLAAAVVAGVLPLAIAYWLPSDSAEESYQRTRLIAFLVSIGTSFIIVLRTAAWLMALGLPVIAVMALVWVELAWVSVGRRMPGATTHPVGRALVRARLTEWLAFAATAAALLLSVWLLDEQVTDLYLRKLSLSRVLFVLAVCSVLLLLPLRWLALWVLTGARMNGREHGFWWRLWTGPYILPTALGVPLLTGWSFVSHAMFQGGADVQSGAIWTAGSVFVTLVLGGSSCIALVNRSSGHSLAAARASHAYLGASNPSRHVTDVGADVTSPQPDDDLPWHHYRPDRAGGPIHLINVFVDQSLDRVSRRRVRDRQGVNMAVGPVGISLGPGSHAMWTDRMHSSSVHATLQPRGGADRPDPFEPRQPGDGDPVLLYTTALPLSDWIAISGATVPSDPRATTKLGTSLLLTLSNLRAGFWWDSGIEDHERDGQAIPPARTLRRWLRLRFRTQRMLVAELTGRFSGPWRRYWHLSDGSRGDGLGLYELVRRRVPIIICADATRDEAGGLVALANTIRLVRLDLGADIEFLTAAERDRCTKGLPSGVADALGTLDDLRSEPRGNGIKHAALARVRYDNAPSSVLLYVRALTTGDEPVEVVEYKRQHPRFPNQSVKSQFLDEAQWESYRLLGKHCANPLVSAGGLQWLADVRRAWSSHDTETTRV